MLMGRGLQNRLHSIGVSVTDTKRIRELQFDSDREFVEESPMIPPMKSSGMNTAVSDTVMARIVNPTSADPSSAAASASSHFQVPHDVLEHHDRVVDDEPDRERHAISVRLLSEYPQVHHGKRRRATSGARGWGLPSRIRCEKNEDHHHHEEQREHQGELHFVNGVLDRN